MTKILKKAEKYYYQVFFNNNSKNPKMIWKKINEITNRNKKSTNNNDSKDKIDCTKFNHLFCNIGQSLASSFGDRINYNDIDNTIFNRMESIYLYPVDNDEVLNQRTVRMPIIFRSIL